MFVRNRTLGIFVKKKDRGEADQVLIIFTKNFGKLKILGRGIRKIKSKLRAGVQPFDLSEIEFIQGKAYKTLTDTIQLKNFSGIRKDLNKLKIAFKIGEATDNLVRGEEPDVEIWSLLSETLKKLNDLSFSYNSYWLFFHHFLWKLLSILGYKPVLNECAVCQKKLTPTLLYFSSEHGGIVCSKCIEDKEKKISPETVKILRILLNKDWNFLSRFKIEQEHKKELKKISEDYLSYLYDTLDIS